jgi:hypothetical protein
MISDVLVEAKAEIKEYLQGNNYEDQSEIKALVTLMNSIQCDLDTAPGCERILTVKTFLKEVKAVSVFILYLVRKFWRNIFRKKDIKYYRPKNE